MDDTWTDPRYAELVEAFDEMKRRRQRQGPTHPCPACQHGLGTIMMVDLETKAPLSVVCICSPGR